MVILKKYLYLWEKNNKMAKNIYGRLKNFDLEVKDDGYLGLNKKDNAYVKTLKTTDAQEKYFDKHSTFIDATEYTIGTQTDSSVGMYGWSKGKSGKEYKFSPKQFNNLSDKKLGEISKDLYSE